MALLTCHDCGGKVSSDAATCPHCGAPVKPAPVSQPPHVVNNSNNAPAAGSTTAEIKPNSWLIWAILSTLLCCLPLGIVGIVYASKVDSAWYAGRYDEARAAADKAKTFTFLSAGLALALYVIYFVYLIVVMGVM